MPPHTKSTPMYAGSMQRHRRSSTASESSCSDSGSESSGSSNGGHRENKQLLRTWLIRVANQKIVPGIEWLDDNHTLLKIPWTHGSRHGFEPRKDSNLFRLWAVHSGRFIEHKDTPDPKRWKANFRCAMNSLPDVKEEESMSQRRGARAYKVYKFLDEKPRKSTMRYKQQRPASTKATKKEKLKQERTRKLQHSIAEQTRRMIGVRRICVPKSEATSTMCEPSSPTTAIMTSFTSSSTTPAAASSASSSSQRIKHNSQLLKRSASRNNQLLKSSPPPTPVSQPPVPALAPFSTAFARTSLISGSTPPADFARNHTNQGYPRVKNEATTPPATLSPTTSIPTFVEADYEDLGSDFNLLQDDALLSDELTEEEIAVNYIQEDNQLWKEERRVEVEELYGSSHIEAMSTAATCRSSPTLSSLNGSVDEEVMEIDIKELDMEEGDAIEEVICEYSGQL